MNSRLQCFRCVVLLAFLSNVLVAAQRDSESEAQLHFTRAHEAQNAGDFRTAIAEYLIVARLQPDTGEVYASLGLAYHAASQFADSAQALRKAISLKPQLRGPNLFLGIDYVRLGQPERAVPCLRRAIEQEPGNREALSWLGTALWESGHIDAALQQLRKASAAFPADGDLLFLLGESYRKAASRVIERVLAQSMGTPLYHEVFGNIYLEQHAAEKAEGHFRKMLQKEPNASGAHFGLGELYLQQGRSAEAVQHLDAAMRASKEEAADELDLPDASVDIERSDEEKARYQAAAEALKGVADCPARHLALAYVDAQLNLHSESLAEWQRAGIPFVRRDFVAESQRLEAFTSADPRNLRALYILGKTYQRLFKVVVSQMISIDPDFYRVHELMAKSYERVEEKEKALAEFRTVERMRPTLPGLHFEIGHLLWTMQDQEAALQELREELRLNPDHAEANAEVGTILAAQEDPNEGVPYLQKAVLLKPSLTPAHIQLGMAFYKLHKFPEAVVELKKALGDDPEGNAHYIVGMVYRRMGRLAESKAALDESRRIRSERLMQVKIEKDDLSQ